MSITEQYFSLLASGATLQDLVDFAEIKIFHNPIIVVNESFRVLAMTGKYSPDDPFWNDARELGRFSMIRINTLRDEPEALRLSHHDGPFLSKTGFCSKIPRIMNSINANGNTHAYIMILESEQSFPQDAIPQTELLCKAVSILLQNTGTADHNTGDFSRYNLEQLLSGRPANITELTAAFPFEKYVVMAGRIPTRKNRLDTAHYLCERITSFSEYMRSFVYQDYLFILLNFTDEGARSLIQDRVFASLEDFGIKLGVSNSFPDISDVGIYFKQACALHDSGQMVDPKKNVYFFTDYYRFLIFSYLPAEVSIANSTIEYQILKEYDDTHNAELIQTLYDYFLSSLNINATAERMHVHRNTIAYRLNIISEKLGIDYNDIRILQLLFLSREYERWLCGTRGRNDN